jgi:acetyl esterase
MNLSSFATRSYKEYGEKYTLTRNEMEYFRRNYLKQEEEARNPHVSPLLAEDLSNLPSAHIITAECDVLTDEAKAYADRLRAAGVPVTYASYEGLIHGFFRLGNSIDRAREALNEAGSALRTIFAG